MKKKYLKSMTAHVFMVMLSLLCLTGHQTVGAQNRNMGEGILSGGSSAANVSSPQKAVMPPMTKSGGNAVSVNGTEYATWADAVTAINGSSEANFDIKLLDHVIDAKTMPNKSCTISGTTASTNFAYVNDAASLARIQMLAPLTFKDITLQVWQIAANGYALTFDEGVTVASQYTSGQNQITGIRNIWGGTDNTNDVASTNITIKSGQFGWITGGSGSTGNVTGTATVTMSGGIINGSIFGGGYESTCGNTDVTMSGGSTRWIYGGGEQGSVTNTAKLTISGTALITETIFGGSDTGSCDSTNVAINGGTIKQNVYTGGFHGVVTGLSSIVVDGAKIDPDELGGGVYSGGDIYGGGFGENNVDNDKGKVGSTQVVIKGLAKGSHHNNIYGGGLYSKVTGNTDVTIEGGDIQSVYASGYNYTSPGGVVGGNVNLHIKGGTIELVSAARGQEWDAAASVTGTMSITMEGGTVKNYIRSGNELTGGVYKECTLTIKKQGSESNPYTLPGIYTITNLVLDNSVVKFKEPQPVQPIVQSLYGFTVMEDHPVKITGSGKLVGTNIFVHPLLPSSFSPNKPIVVAENLPKATTFAHYVKIENNSFITTPIYKAGKTYRMKKEDETLYTVGIAAPETEGVGTVSVKWDQFDSKDVMLEDGDQVPGSASITPKAEPNDEGITVTLKNGETEITSGTAIQLAANAAFSAEFVIQPLDLNGKDEDITISKAGKIWKYTKAAITKAPATPISFNGTIQNTLADKKRVLIDETAQGALTFESAKINSTTTAAPALTIASGAKVSFSGNLEVKTGEANQYGIVNNGSLTITGASTKITAANTTASSDKGIKVNEAASMVAEAGTKLTTSGMENTGTVVVKDGAIAETAGGIALQKTYLVTIANPGNGNKLVLKAGADIAVSDQDKVADKTVLTVSGVPASGYTLESITVTPKGGQAVTLNNNSTYTMPESEVSFAATFKQQTPPTPPETTYHSVTLPAVEGATTNPVAGIHQVESWSNFRFTLTLDKEYSQSTPIVTTSRGETIVPNVSDSAYVVTYVREPVVISINGIVKNTPVGNVSADADGTKVWNIGSTLYIQTLSKESVRITSFSGALLRQFIIPGGDYQTQMPEGLYIVQVGEDCFKVKM